MSLLLFSPRLHVQSPTCSSRSSSTNVSCTRRCWWSSSNFPLIPPPLPPRLVCILPVAPPEALSPANQPWIPSQALTKLQASPTHCTPKSRRLRPTPTAPTLSVSLRSTSNSVNLTKYSLIVVVATQQKICKMIHSYCSGLGICLNLKIIIEKCLIFNIIFFKETCVYTSMIFHLLTRYECLYCLLNKDQCRILSCK